MNKFRINFFSIGVICRTEILMGSIKTLVREIYGFENESKLLDFLDSSDYQNSHAKNKMKDFSLERSCTTLKFSIEKLLEKKRLAVTEKYEFECRHKSKYLRQIHVRNIFWTIRNIKIFLQEQNRHFFSFSVC